MWQTSQELQDKIARRTSPFALLSRSLVAPILHRDQITGWRTSGCKLDGENRFGHHRLASSLCPNGIQQFAGQGSPKKSGLGDENKRVLRQWSMSFIFLHSSCCSFPVTHHSLCELEQTYLWDCCRSQEHHLLKRNGENFKNNTWGLCISSNLLTSKNSFRNRKNFTK